jgi:TolA-binding protein
MSKPTEDNNDLLSEVQHAYSRTERYIDENRKSLLIILGGVVAVVLGYFAWEKLYVAPMEEKAQSEMFAAQQYFENDSLDKAIKGDGNHPGFLTLSQEYGVTKSGNLAHYYLGICYLRKGKYEDALAELKQFDTDNALLAHDSTGAMGDANLEMGKTDEAVYLYLKAAKMSENKFTTPIYLMKAAGVYEDKKDFETALKIYDQIKNEYPNTNEGREIEKYIARAKASQAA